MIDILNIIEENKIKVQLEEQETKKRREEAKQRLKYKLRLHQEVQNLLYDSINNIFKDSEKYEVFYSDDNNEIIVKEKNIVVYLINIQFYLNGDFLTCYVNIPRYTWTQKFTLELYTMTPTLDIQKFVTNIIKDTTYQLIKLQLIS